MPIFQFSLLANPPKNSADRLWNILFYKRKSYKGVWRLIVIHMYIYFCWQKHPHPSLDRTHKGLPKSTLKYAICDFQTVLGLRKFPGHRSVRLASLLSIVCCGILCNFFFFFFPEFHLEKERDKDREERFQHSWSRPSPQLCVICQFPRNS